MLRERTKKPNARRVARTSSPNGRSNKKPLRQPRKCSSRAQVRSPSLSKRLSPPEVVSKCRYGGLLLSWRALEDARMSVVSENKRVTVPEIRAHKSAKPIVALTCYHAHTARLLDEHVDMMLVGDSLGMVMHGMESTLGVTLDMMITHGRAVMRGSHHALVAVDMP